MSDKHDKHDKHEMAFEAAVRIVYTAVDHVDEDQVCVACLTRHMVEVALALLFENAVLRNTELSDSERRKRIAMISEELFNNALGMAQAELVERLS